MTTRESGFFKFSNGTALRLDLVQSVVPMRDRTYSALPNGAQVVTHGDRGRATQLAFYTTDDDQPVSDPHGFLIHVKRAEFSEFIDSLPAADSGERKPRTFGFKSGATISMHMVNEVLPISIKRAEASPVVTAFRLVYFDKSDLILYRTEDDRPWEGVEDRLIHVTHDELADFLTAFRS